jgi:hypothetical protein
MRENKGIRRDMDGFRSVANGKTAGVWLMKKGVNKMRENHSRRTTPQGN